MLGTGFNQVFRQSFNPWVAGYNPNPNPQNMPLHVQTGLGMFI